MGKPFYMIPAELAEAGKPTKALLYGCIVSFCYNDKGYCWASNLTLAKKLSLKNPGNISQYIQELEKEGWLIIDRNKKNRKIWFARDPYGKTIDPFRKKEFTPSEKPEESNIRSNIKSNINNSKQNTETSMIAAPDKSGTRLSIEEVFKSKYPDLYKKLHLDDRKNTQV